MKRIAGLAHRHDLALVALVALNLTAIAALLGAGPAEAPPGAGGWRRVDLEEVTRRVETGDLSAREALWYHIEPRRGAEGR